MDLIYQYDSVPLIPAPTAETAFMQDSSQEQFPIVEPNGIVVGRSTRDYCHGGAKPLHPVVHVHIIDRFGNIYLQKRPMSKKIQPGKWDTAVGGHVSFGENLLEAVFRESSEELGLIEFNPVYLRSYVYESDIEKELINIYAAVGSYELHPDEDELDGGGWWPMSEVDECLGTGVFTPNFESEYEMIRDALTALL